MNQKSAIRTIDIKVPVIPGGRPATGKSKSKKPKKKASAGRRQSRRATASDMRDYYFSASLVDPWGVLGAKIPDSVTAASFPCHSVQRFTSVANVIEGGDWVFGQLLDLRPGSIVGGSNCLFQTSTSAGQSGKLKFGGPARTFPNMAGLLVNAAAVRVVSAGLAITYTGSLLNTQGTIIAGFLPRGSNPSFDTTTSYSIADFLNFPHIKQCTVQYGKPCSVVWTPPELSRNYYRNSVDTEGIGQLFIVSFGLKDSTSSFDISAVMNWECLPTDKAQGLIPSTPSTCSFRALEIAANVLATRSVFHAPINDIQNASSNQESVVDDGGTTTAYVMEKLMGLDLREDVLRPLSNGMQNVRTSWQLAQYAAQGFASLRESVFAPGGMSGSAGAIPYSGLS